MRRIDLDLHDEPEPLRTRMKLGNAHWAEFLPEKYAGLVESGELLETLRAAAKLTQLEYRTLLLGGCCPEEAEAEALKLFILLPEEFEVARRRRGVKKRA